MRVTVSRDKWVAETSGDPPVNSYDTPYDGQSTARDTPIEPDEIQ
jgi:hypothetical protein